ncbi:MAG TPA: ABC transporter substrate-binding protein [Anaerolineaceae bacterium]|nr:ABC transporter substrate-binding protein [Anaerolineaceae bacterium]
MNRLTSFIWCLLTLVLSLTLVGCQTPAQAAAFQPLSITAPNCEGSNLIQSIEALDETTVRFTLCSADPDFASKVAFITFAIQDLAYLNEMKGDSALMNENPVGTGPYIVKRREANQIVLGVNPTYWGVPPGVGEIVIIGKRAPTDRVQAVITGSADVADSPAVSDLNRISTMPNLSAQIRPALSTIYLGMNNKIAPFDNPKVREAIAKAIDRNDLVHVFYPFGSLAADQFVPPILSPGFTNGMNWYAYDPEEARALLEEAGYDFNQEIDIAFNADPTAEVPEPFRLATYIQSQLRRIGVNIRLRPLVGTAFDVSVDTGQESLYLQTWNFAPPDALSFYRAHFLGANDPFGTIPQELIDQIVASGTESNIFSRQQRYDRINGLIKENIFGVPLAHFAGTLVFNNTVQNISVTPFNESLIEMNTPTDRLTFMQTRLPEVLWPADETDADSFRVAGLIYESLTTFSDEGLSIKPALAEYWENNPGNTQWTFYLRHSVKFSNGSALDANDVVASFAAQWNVASPNHVGRTGDFTYFKRFFGGFISTDPNIKPKQ